MAKKVIVTLTPLEAYCLWQAAGNTICYADSLAGAFDTKAEQRAAQRAYDKLTAAWAKEKLTRRASNA